MCKHNLEVTTLVSCLLYLHYIAAVMCRTMENVDTTLKMNTEAPHKRCNKNQTRAKKQLVRAPDLLKYQSNLKYI